MNCSITIELSSDFEEDFLVTMNCVVDEYGNPIDDDF